MWQYGQDSSGSGYEPVVGFSEHGMILRFYKMLDIPLFVFKGH
jgi:hypothetical protein